MRSDIINAVNKLSMQSENTNIDVVKMYNLIFDYCKKNGTAVKNLKLELINGLFFINKEPLERVAPLPPRVAYSEKAYYYAGKCIIDY